MYRVAGSAGIFAVSQALPLILFIALSGCSGSYGKSEYQQVKEQQQAFVELFAEAGGSGKREPRSMHGYHLDGWLIDLSGVEITDELIEAMIEIAQTDPIFQLNLSRSTITDEQLAQLDEGSVIQKCFDLDLSDTAVTDAGLDRLTNTYVIHDLKLKGTSVSKEAVQRLGDRQLAKEETPAPFKRRPKVDL